MLHAQAESRLWHQQWHSVVLHTLYTVTCCIVLVCSSQNTKSLRVPIACEPHKSEPTLFVYVCLHACVRASVYMCVAKHVSCKADAVANT